MTAASQPARYPAWGAYFTGLTQELPSQDVLDKLNISQTMVSRWAKGSARPQDIARAKEVATLLGGNPEDAERAIRADTIKTVTPSSSKTAKKARKRTAAKTAKKPAARRVAAARARANGAPRSNVIGNPLDRIRATRNAIQQAERDLDEAVNAARTSGMKWEEIAGALR
jgi:transcriptional regulator with XRE-family HTH domain